MERTIGTDSANPAAGNHTSGAVTLQKNAARGLPSSAYPNCGPKTEYADAQGSDREMQACASTTAQSATL
jgi:hypothetical protein